MCHDLLQNLWTFSAHYLQLTTTCKCAPCCCPHRYYTTTYATKLPENQSCAAAMLLAYDRAVEREGKLTQTPQQILNSRTSAYLHACTKVLEVSATMATKYLLDGSLHYCSHSFEPVFCSSVIAHYDDKPYQVTMVQDYSDSCDSTTQRSYKASVPRFFDYVFRGEGMFDDMSYYDFVSAYTRLKIVYDPDAPGAHCPLHERHPLSSTHCIGTRKHPVVPQMIGKRLPDVRRLNTVDGAEAERYHKTSLLLHKPHSATNPPWSPNTSASAEFAAWTPAATAQMRLDRHQDYYDQQKLARNSAQVRKALLTINADQGPQGMCLDDFADGGAEMLDAIALQAIGGKPPARTMPATLRRHLHLVAASVAAKTALAVGCLEVDPSIYDEVDAAAPPTSTAWDATPTSMMPITNSTSAASIGPVAEPRALLVSRALASAATASANNHRCAQANLVEIEHPSLADVAAKFNLNREQHVAFRMACLHLLSHYLALADDTEDVAQIDEAQKQLQQHGHQNESRIMAMMGEGGTGKSEVIKAITHFASAWGLRQHLALTAFTGSAAILIDGCTLHSWSGMNSRRSTKGNYNTAQVADDPTTMTQLLVVDEVSLVSAELLGKLDEILQRKRGSNKPFGGMAIMFSGDMYQLPPVDGLALYNTSERATTAGGFATKGFAAWGSLTQVVVLQTNYRAAGDKAFANLLGHVRDHKVTQDDIETLEACRVSSAHMPPIDSPTAWHANLDVNATNATTALYSAAVVGKKTYRLTAELHERRKREGECITPNSVSHAGYSVGSRANDKAKLPVTHLDVHHGCPMTLYIGNKLTKHKVANGSRGTLVGSHPPLAELAHPEPTDVILPDGTTHTVQNLTRLPDYLLVHVPGSTVRFQNLPLGTVPVKLEAVRVHVHGHKTKLYVSQFPVRLNYGWTTHKLQGKTEDRLVLATTNRHLNFNYTALSRVRSLKDLYILKGVKLTVDLFNHHSEEHDMLTQDMKRLLLLSGLTMSRFGDDATQ